MRKNRSKTTQSQPKLYTQDDLLQFENKNIHSSIVVLSKQASAPRYGFGSSERKHQDNIYAGKQLNKYQNAGRIGPGPAYNLSGFNYTFLKDPSVKIGSEKRQGLGGPKFEHYNRIDVDFEPEKADNLRRSNQPRARIGVESRFRVNKSLATPGPQYDISTNVIVKKTPVYTIGQRRGYSAVLLNSGSTSSIVPVSYLPLGVVSSSINIKQPQFSFPQEERFINYKSSRDINQTYDMKQRSMGQQVNSKKQSGPVYSVGRGHRCIICRFKIAAQLSYFKSSMVKVPQPLRISHPKI